GVTILESNLIGHTCGRVCPGDELCVGACVLGDEHRPIAIGRPQRDATGRVCDRGLMPFEPAAPAGRKGAGSGAAPAPPAPAARRVCPVDGVCVGACVLGDAHGPIAIGRLQRYATDRVLDRGIMPFEPAAPTGRKVAVIGAGPAGLSAAGELAKLGVEVDVFERNELPGGLSTYGIVVMREPVKVSLDEVEFIERLGVNITT